jgi:uncharacterized protein (TIGR02186 family)
MLVKFILKTIVLSYAAFVMAVLLNSNPAWALTVKATPQDIPINLLYNGVQLSIKGKSDVNDDLIIKISNTPGDAHMRYKGKAAGLFWMKMGDIRFEHVPAAYLLATSRGIDQLLQKDEQIAEGIGFESIKAATNIESSAEGIDRERWINEFIKLKQAEKLYQIHEGTVKKQNGEYRLDLKWPYQAAPDTYKVEVLAVRDGRIVDRSETGLTVARSGIVAKLSRLAFGHAAVYGLVAIVIAILAGFAVGALFKKGGGAH